MNQFDAALSIREISRRISVPESTLRYYRKLFGELVPTAGMGRSRRHPESAVGLFREISQRFAAGESRARIRRLLEEMGERPPGSEEASGIAGEAYKPVHAVDVARPHSTDVAPPRGRLHDQDVERLLTAMMVRDRELSSVHRELIEMVGQLITTLGSLAKGRLPDESAAESARQSSVQPSLTPASPATETPEIQRLRETLERERVTIERLRHARVELERRLTRLEREKEGK